MIRQRYSEGDWFAVPLRSDSFALGVVARANPKGILLGYFFGPRRPQPSLADVVGLAAERAALIGRFGDLGIRTGSWPLLGRGPHWDHSAWPMPVFVRYEELTGRTFHVRYDNTDPHRLIGESVVTPGSAGQGPKDGLMGAGFVERRLTSLLT